MKTSEFGNNPKYFHPCQCKKIHVPILRGYWGPDIPTPHSLEYHKTVGSLWNTSQTGPLGNS